MRADKRCKNCEWWDVNGELGEGGEHRCLRWPGLGGPWLWMAKEDRCWQWAKRTSETEKSMHPAIRGMENDIEQVDQMSSIDDMASSLAHMRLRLALARRVIKGATFAIQDEVWREKAEAWLAVKD